MAEIEHYVDPLDKRHARFDEVKDVKLALLPKDVQQEGKTDLTDMTVGDAVGQVSSIFHLCQRFSSSESRKSSTTRLWGISWRGPNCSWRRSV